MYSFKRLLYPDPVIPTFVNLKKNFKALLLKGKSFTDIVSKNHRGKMKKVF